MHIRANIEARYDHSDKALGGANLFLCGKRSISIAIIADIARAMAADTLVIRCIKAISTNSFS
jgi:hypothetical protein